MDYNKFSIGRQTGVIRTATTFDCEMKKEYYVTVVAEDGAPSDRPNHYPSRTPNMGISLSLSLSLTHTNLLTYLLTQSLLLLPLIMII